MTGTVGDRAVGRGDATIGVMFREFFSSGEARASAHSGALTRRGAGEALPAPFHARPRLWLLAGSALLLAAPLALLAPAAHWASDPELFRLLRGMAAIKALLAVLAFAAVWWRLGRGLTPRFAASYVGGVWGLAFAAGLIWQLTAVPLASGLFHCATILLLITAWRDAGPAFERRRQVPDARDQGG